VNKSLQVLRYSNYTSIRIVSTRCKRLARLKYDRFPDPNTGQSCVQLKKILQKCTYNMYKVSVHENYQTMKEFNVMFQLAS